MLKMKKMDTYNGLTNPDLDELRLLDEGQPVAPDQRSELLPPGGLKKRARTVSIALHRCAIFVKPYQDPDPYYETVQNISIYILNFHKPKILIK
jgi:hypothetical protein